MTTNTMAPTTAWDQSLRATLATVEDLEYALMIFKYDVSKTLEATDLKNKESWEELAVWDLKDVKRLMSKLNRDIK